MVDGGKRGGGGEGQLLRIQGFPGQRLALRQRLRRLHRGGVGRFRWAFVSLCGRCECDKGATLSRSCRLVL